MKTLIEKIDDIIEELEEKEMESVVELMNLVRKKVEQADDEPAVLEITPEYCSDYFKPYKEDDEDEDEFFDPNDVSDMAWWVK